MRYFENLHPICILCYFVAVIGLTLTCFHPVMLLVSLLGALAFLIRLKGGRGAVRHLSFVIPMSLLVAIANPLINHRGVTLLGLFLNQWITLEAIAYGITAGLSLAALILWFGCYSEVMKDRSGQCPAHQHGTSVSAEAQPSAHGDQGKSGDAPPGAEKSER